MSQDGDSSLPHGSTTDAVALAVRPQPGDKHSVIHTPLFSLEPAPGWVAAPASDPEQISLRHRERDIVATLSAIEQAIAATEMDCVTETFLRLRLHAEEDAAQAFARTSFIYEPVVVPRPWGRSVVYYGHDEEGRQFGLCAHLTLRGIITLYLSGARLTEAELLPMMDGLCSALVFDRTPFPDSAEAAPEQTLSPDDMAPDDLAPDGDTPPA